MTLPAKIDTTAAMAAYIYADTSWPAGFAIHALELPPGFAASNAVLILPDGGIGREIPQTEERFSFWCYGTTPYAARGVADALFRVLHRKAPAQVTITAGTAIVGPIVWAMGPTYFREPETEWPRWICAVDATFGEWVLP